MTLDPPTPRFVSLYTGAGLLHVVLLLSPRWFELEGSLIGWVTVCTLVTATHSCPLPFPLQGLAGPGVQQPAAA